MRYSELIHFEPLESVMQLKDTKKEERARDFVSTYVISKPMSDNLSKVVFSNLRVDTPGDNKGLFIVGNYGTGKSHLMGVLASIAENANLTEMLTDESVRESATQIAGKFKVIRSEIGATEMPLRDIVLSELKMELSEMGIEFDFPSIDKVTNNKDTLNEMMSLFCEKYPDKGLLLVIDELLDYLRHRKEQSLVLDMTFLRELGEFCKSSRFRFIAGIQEALYDNPAFEFASDAVRRVKERFIDIRIAREDIEYVVANRLLKKSESQKARIREHLQKFTKYYGSMNERLDSFVNLFPIHPSFISMFERIRFIEHREVLQTLTKVMSDLLDERVPEDAPGMVSYDTYWDRISSRSDLVTVPEIRQTKEKSDELVAKIRAGMEKHRLDNAVRITKALSVHRLSTVDINTKIGPTIDELRDDLLIYDPAIEDLGGDPQENLSTMVEGVLNKIINIVSGQYIAFIKENGQYYLDLNKTIDFDSQIEKKRSTMSDEAFNKNYYSILAKLMECSDRTYVPGHRIWQYELLWQSKNSTRLGYLFFGQPNERSTAHPPRDFYIYFLPLFKTGSFKDEGSEDEVFFSIADIDRDFEDNLKNYAAALELSQTAGSHKTTYIRLSEGYLSRCTSWLTENLVSAYSVTYKKSSKSIPEIYSLRNKPFKQLDGFKEIIDDISSTLLDSYFSDTALGYPKFETKMTSQNRNQIIETTIRGMINNTLSRQSKETLSSLHLLNDNGDIVTSKSPYVKKIMSLLEEKPVGSVLNRNELFEITETGEYLMPFRLEPEWVVVLLAAMLYMGEIELSLTGEKLDASSLDKLQKLSVDDLVNFKNIRLPKDLPVSTIRELFSLLKINEGQVSQLQNGDSAPVENMLRRSQSNAEDLAKLNEKIKNGIDFWEEPLLQHSELEERMKKIKRLKDFFDS
ncbi:MAG: putative ATPase, VrlK family, partial [Mesotoga infera]